MTADPLDAAYHTHLIEQAKEATDAVHDHRGVTTKKALESLRELQKHVNHLVNGLEYELRVIATKGHPETEEEIK